MICNNSAGAQPPQGTKTVGAAPNVRRQPVCRDSGNRRSRTRVRSPHPLKESRKRRAISIKSGKCRTGSRTPVGFTVLDATIVSAPTNNNTNPNDRLDFMTQDAERGAATAASAEHRSCTLVPPPWRTSIAPSTRATTRSKRLNASCLSGAPLRPCDGWLTGNGICNEIFLDST